MFSYDDFMQDLENISYSLQKEIKVKIDKYKLILRETEAKLKAKSPQNQIELKKQSIKDIENKMHTVMMRKLSDTKGKFCIMAERLNGMSPLTKLSSGYSYVSNKNKVVKSIKNVKTGDILRITVTDGYIDAVAECIEKEEK